MGVPQDKKETIREGFFRLVCQLSPENLCCDGELPPAQVKARYKKLKAEWAVLEKKLGRPVYEGEVWGWIQQEAKK